MEATAIGNIAVQLIAGGEIKDVEQARGLLDAVKTYKPENTAEWNRKYEDYLRVTRG